MCVISNVGDWWTQKYPSVPDLQQGGSAGLGSFVFQDTGLRMEFEQLKREVQELRELLLKAKEIDEKTGQPDCEAEEKVRLIKEIAKIVGVSMSDIFKDCK